MPLISQIAAVRAHAGIWMRRDHAMLRFHGRDAGAWLHGQTTNDVQGLVSDQGNLQALVNRQGRLLCVFELYRFEDEFWAIIETTQLSALLDRHESHRFLEDAEVEVLAESSGQILIEGPHAQLFLWELLEPAPSLGETPLPEAAGAFQPVRLCGHDALVFRSTETGEDGYLIIPAPGEEDALYEALAAEGMARGVEEISEAARNTLRFESGLPRYGIDWNDETVIAETPFERLAVRYDKGCYPGQEVVTRLKTYGTPKRALVGLLAEGDDPRLPEHGDPVSAGEIRIGTWCGHAYSPTLGRWIGRAYLNRTHRTEGETHALTGPHGESFRGEVRHLPLVEPGRREDFANRLYHDALAIFERDTHDQDESAIHLLENVIRLVSNHEDAYEVLGVILHRHHRVDEAIAIMKKLAVLNPACVMAHTNLSVFYLSKGLIQEAEEEKAIAGQLEFQHQLDARQAAKRAGEERARIRAEAEERIAMFREVLDIDPEDPIATMGMGSAHMQLEQYAEAIPYLEAAARLQKDYSAAFLNLGKCHEFSGQPDAARAAYRDGIAAAGRKGDLMPMREMERRLKALGG